MAYVPFSPHGAGPAPTANQQPVNGQHPGYSNAPIVVGPPPGRQAPAVAYPPQSPPQQHYGYHSGPPLAPAPIPAPVPASAPPQQPVVQAGPPIPMKIVVSGGFGVGKTTFVSSISDIPPLTTEASMTSVSRGVDNRGEVSTKTTTTVAMDFGRVAVDSSLVLYIFGTPGQDRFGFMWDDLVTGALGAVVLVDSRRLDDCFAALDYFEDRGIPVVVAVNQFDGQLAHSLDDVRTALSIDTDVPVVAVDARSKDSVKWTILALLDVVLNRAMVQVRRT